MTVLICTKNSHWFSFSKTTSYKNVKLICLFKPKLGWETLLRVATCQGKVREKHNFLQVRELSGNFKKMSGNFGHLTNVREMSGNFVMTINFFSEHGWHLFACIHFQVLKFLLALLHPAYIPIIPFSKCFITSMSTVLYYCFLAKTFNIDIGIFNCF